MKPSGVDNPAGRAIDRERSAYRFAGQPICSVLGNQMLIS
jgi:hypothetical protein